MSGFLDDNEDLLFDLGVAFDLAGHVSLVGVGGVAIVDHLGDYDYDGVLLALVLLRHLLERMPYHVAILVPESVLTNIV